jgi:acetyl-CoA carboxylase carboxyl transferase subunit beta
VHAHGLIDAVVRPDQLAGVVTDVLTVVSAAPPAPDPVRAPPDEPLRPVPAAESIRRSRRPDRPSVRALLRSAARNVTPLRGTGEGESDAGLLLALARIGAAACVLIGHARDDQGRHRPIGPAGLRVARRGMRLAGELDLPLLTVIDTPGAELSPHAEEHGLAGEIARCLADLMTLPTPTLSLLLGQGAGGAALAFFPADRVVAAEHGWLSPLPPEGASEILYRTTARAGEIAEQQGIRSTALYARGIVDRIVAEQPDAADAPADFLRRVGQVLEYELLRLRQQDPAARLAHRHARYRALSQ